MVEYDFDFSGENNEILHVYRKNNGKSTPILEKNIGFDGVESFESLERAEIEIDYAIAKDKQKRMRDAKKTKTWYDKQPEEYKEEQRKKALQRYYEDKEYVNMERNEKQRLKRREEKEEKIKEEKIKLAKEEKQKRQNKFWSQFRTENIKKDFPLKKRVKRKQKNIKELIMKQVEKNINNREYNLANQKALDLFNEAEKIIKENEKRINKITSEKVKEESLIVISKLEKEFSDEEKN